MTQHFSTMDTASYEFLMKSRESAAHRQTLSSRVWSGDETRVILADCTKNAILPDLTNVHYLLRKLSLCATGSTHTEVSCPCTCKGGRESKHTLTYTPISPLNKAPVHNQGVVTYVLPFDAFATRIKIFDQIHVKVCLIFPSKVLDCLIFCGSKVELEPRALGPQFSCYLDPLIGSQKGL